MHQFHSSKAFSGFVALQKSTFSAQTQLKKIRIALRTISNSFQRVSKSTIAHYLGVSRETLSRLSKKP
jgi:CRP-like cAMP-binding protein